MKQKTKPRVLLIGDPIIDIYHYGKASRISPEAPLVVFKKDHTVCRLGGALNLGANLLSFCDVDFYCSEYMGIFYVEQIDVNDSNFIRKTRFIDIDYNIPTGLRFDEDKEYDEFTRFFGLFGLEENFANDKYDYIVLSDYDKGTIGENCLNKISELIGHHLLKNRKSPPIFIDTKTNDFSKFRLFSAPIDFFKPNELEFKKYEKFHKENIVKYTRGIFDNIFITKSKNGISFCKGKNVNSDKEEDNLLNIPTFCEKLVDVTGAGDSAMAGLIYGFNKVLNGRKFMRDEMGIEDYESMAVYANAFAKLACENKGTFVTTPDHLPQIEKIAKEYYAKKKT